MLLYRICRTIYGRDLTGMGSGLYGGRWNPRGMNMLYTAGSISLACLEYLVHNFHVISTDEICLIKIHIGKPVSLTEVLKENLPADWSEKSYIPQSTQKIGQEFMSKQSSYILKVPSAVVPDEHNYLLNPLHPDHNYTGIHDIVDSFRLDERLFKP